MFSHHKLRAGPPSRPEPSLGTMLIALATLLHAPPPTARAIVVALSPMEQYQQQQQKLREQRMQRVEAEEAAARGETAAALPAEDEGFRARFAAQLHAFDTELFPPEQYSQRNQESRKDGYWAFVGKGEEPPLDFTYGEFPLPLFSQLVDRACELRGILTLEARRDAVLIDLGSGAGRLALWAAATSVWRRVVGVEYLPTLAASASAKLAEARDASRFPGLLQTSDVHLVEGSWDDPLDLFGDVDVRFTATWPLSASPALPLYIPPSGHIRSRTQRPARVGSRRPVRLACRVPQVAFAYTTAITANEDGVLEALSAALTKRLRVRAPRDIARTHPPPAPLLSTNCARTNLSHAAWVSCRNHRLHARPLILRGDREHRRCERGRRRRLHGVYPSQDFGRGARRRLCGWGSRRDAAAAGGRTGATTDTSTGTGADTTTTGGGSSSGFACACCQHGGGNPNNDACSRCACEGGANPAIWGSR